MDQNSVILYAIIVVVLIGIPVILSRKSGKKPMEILFGRTRNPEMMGHSPPEPGPKNRPTATGMISWI